MRHQFLKTSIYAVAIIGLGGVSIAATDTYTRTHGDIPIGSSDARKTRHNPLASFYLNESLKLISFADGQTSPNNKKTFQMIYERELAKLNSQIPTEKWNSLRAPVSDAVHGIKRALWDLKSDCIVTPLSNTKKHKDLETFYVITEAGLSTLQNDCLRAVSMYTSPVDRLSLETRAHTAYKNVSSRASDDYNLIALDELEKAYLTFLYLAITEPNHQTKRDYFYIVGLVGLKLWSFNKDDAAMLPLIALSAESLSTQDGISAWLLLKDHVQFSNSGSAGERVPIYWNVVLYTIGKK